jgi:O-antigen ligase
MPANLAALVFGLVIAGLFYLDRDDDSRPSPALWLAVVWMFIGASRMPSEWFGQRLAAAQLDLYLEGSPFDRLFLSGILTLLLVVLIVRGGRTSRLLTANGPLTVFFLYCLLTVLWSDYSFVAFKRWTKALGNIAMVLVVLTDPYPAAAIKRLFARTGFFLIPLSVLLVKYYPDLGRIYSHWTWTSTNIGVATDKNGLGAICLVFGLAALWRFVQAYRERAAAWRTRQLAAHGSVLAMVLWLLVKADSSTALACFLLGGGIILCSTLPGAQRAARANAIALTVTVCPLIIAVLFQDVYANFVEGLGRNTTLTGRTDIWRDLLRLDLNPWIGTGFESFWLGARADYFWLKYSFHPNQAHNGYLETYITLGWIGVVLLLLVVVAGYRNTIRLYQRDSIAGSLSLTFLIVALIYNVTEAAFKVMHPLWIAFLLAVAAGTALPDPSEELEPEDGRETLPCRSAERPVVLLHAPNCTP